VEQSQRFLELRVNRTLWFVAKIIQAIGLFEVMYGLIIGFKDSNLSLEFRYAGIGLLIFGIGWLIEKKLGGGNNL